MKKSNKPKFLLIIFLLLIIVLGGMKVTQFTYENRCYVIECSPVSWIEILDTAFAQAGNNFRIDGIYASPKWSSEREAGPEFVSIHVMYVSLESDPFGVDEETNHLVKYFEFDDRNLKTIIQTEGGGWASYVPSEDSQNILKNVTVHPRDAFRVTWTLAKNELSFSLENANIVAQLVFDKTLLLFFDDIKSNGGEPIWIVSYSNDKIDLAYHVNAHTSQVIGFFKNYK